MRKLSFTVGLFSLPLVLFLCICVMGAPMSAWGTAYVAGLVIVVAGLLSLPWRTASRGLTRSGVWVVMTAMSMRACAATTTNGHVMLTENVTSGGRLVDLVIDERDVAVTAARALHVTGYYPDHDTAKLGDAMAREYDAMSAEDGAVPSPFVATYLGLEDDGASDTIVINRGVRTSTAIIFLHGFAGNFTLPCWWMARATERVGATTVCPSTRWIGDWWTPEGERILRHTVEALRAQGYEHLYLAGLSNGGVGASVLVTRMPGTFEKLILISGANPDAPPSHIPTLVVTGSRDPMMPPAAMRAYAARSHATFVALDAGHFAMLLKSDEATSAISKWLRPDPEVAARPK